MGGQEKGDGELEVVLISGVNTRTAPESAMALASVAVLTIRIVAVLLPMTYSDVLDSMEQHICSVQP